MPAVAPLLGPAVSSWLKASDPPEAAMAITSVNRNMVMDLCFMVLHPSTGKVVRGTTMAN